VCSSDLIEDAKNAIVENDLGPEDPTNYSQLRGRLEASRNKLPPLYREIFFQPYVNELNQIGEEGFTSILIADPKRQREAGLMLDISQAIIQNGEGYNWIATDAFEEVVSDLYDGFLSAEDRRGIDPPDKGAFAPLVKWGGPDEGPYTWPIDATLSFDVKAAIVNLPPSFAKQGLFAWSTLGHETAGHDIIHAYSGLRRELSRAVQNALDKENFNNGLPDYWSTRLDETTSDILGILNMGPTPGISIIGYFRALMDSRSGKPALNNIGRPNDVHPAMILRGYLASSTIRLLKFKGATAWADYIKSETDKDLVTIELEGNTIDSQMAIRSAEIVATTILDTKFESLGNHSFGEIQNWRNYDEKIVQDLIPIISKKPIPDDKLEDIYAAHIVAASIESALIKNADISSIFSRMLTALKKKHDNNPSWGPLFIKYPGNIYRHWVSER